MSNTPNSSWRDRLADLLPLYGHRNWIAVVDGAYPSQSAPGIETLATGEDIISVLRHVATAVHDAGHVTANVYVDSELAHLDEVDAPGIIAYRAELDRTLAGANVQSIPHEDIIVKLDNAAATFHVLILKTTLALPYTSVFFQLECGYWDPAREERLRSRIAGS